jgi:NTP pyrophosphatase (non-canonical NTP hydrolase)
MNSNDVLTEYGLDALSAILHETAIEKGFWPHEIDTNIVCTKLALVHSEVTEVLEAIRKNKPTEEIVEEIADILIRTLDLYAALRNHEWVTESLDEILETKININKERPRLHGNLF